MSGGDRNLICCTDRSLKWGEIILKVVGGVQTRLVGFFDDRRMVFTIVLVVTKKEPNYMPRDWQQISVKRMNEVKANSGRANEWYP
jgi:hypothetical protein